MLYSLRKFEHDEATMVTMALLASSAWSDCQGERAPTAAQLGTWFQTQDSWMESVHFNWPTAGWGPSPTPEFIDCAIQFWHSLKAACAQEFRAIDTSTSENCLSRHFMEKLQFKKSVPSP